VSGGGLVGSKGQDYREGMVGGSHSSSTALRHDAA
jgi:hypothetical protein